MGGHASHGHTSDLAFKKLGYGEETVVWDYVVIGDFDSRNFHKVKRPWEVPFFRTASSSQPLSVIRLKIQIKVNLF